MAKRTFDQALIFYRNQRELNQTDMAELIGSSMRYYQKLESGKSEPSLSTLEKTLLGLGVSYNEFFGVGEGDSRPAAIRPHSEPRWPELARLLQYFGDAELEQRLLGLYILSENPDYLKQYAAIDRDHAADAAVLRRILATS